jgi:DnaJ homolog subfamily B member 4
MLEITINISPGWKHETKIEYGNQLLVVLHEKPHALFKRVETDLIMTKKISLIDALLGTTFDLTTLDGRVITIHVIDNVTPCYEKVVYGEGMPLHRDPSRRGNLIINFEVEFPNLTTEQKSEVRRILNDVAHD